jgi:hypothetical protein
LTDSTIASSRTRNICSRNDFLTMLDIRSTRTHMPSRFQEVHIRSYKDHLVDKTY